MHEMGLRGNLPAFAEDFLSFWEFCVTLFAIAINEITKQLGSEVHCTLYVDDFTIFV